MEYSSVLDMTGKGLKLSIDPEALSLLTRVSHLLAEQGVRSYLVGGFVRDLLLGRETADIDLAVAADALKVASELALALGGKFVLLDEANRIGRVILCQPGQAGRWQIDLTTIEGDIEDDLGKRDFTIDAMAIELAELGKEQTEVIDPFHGRNDLQRRVVRAVTETALAADAARLLRAVRLAAELGFAIEPGTELLIRQYHHLIADVAAERIREELLRLLAAPESSRSLRYLDTLGLLTEMLPELARLKGVQQPKEHFWDVFDHSVETVAATDFLLRQGGLEYASGQVLSVAPWSEELARHFAQEVSHASTRRSLLKLASLLHDVAKPQTRAPDESGRIRFLGHAREGATVAANALQRLRFSAREVKLVELMVRNHLRPGQMSQGGLPTHRAIYRYFRDTGDAGIDTLFLYLADHLATRGPDLDLNGWQESVETVTYVLAERQKQESLVLPPKLINGHDLINVFGLTPGPRIGALLELLREAQATSEVATREEALEFIRRHLPLTET